MTRLIVRIVAVAVCLLALLCTPAHAGGIIRWVIPAEREAQDDSLAPCGGARPKSNTITQENGGEETDLHWAGPSDGTYRIAISQSTFLNQDRAFDNNVLVEEAGVKLNEEEPAFYEHDPFIIPNFDCDLCTLQLKYTPPSGQSRYVCTDISIKHDPSKDKFDYNAAAMNALYLCLFVAACLAGLGIIAGAFIGLKKLAQHTAAKNVEKRKAQVIAMKEAAKRDAMEGGSTQQDNPHDQHKRALRGSQRSSRAAGSTPASSSPRPLLGGGSRGSRHSKQQQKQKKKAASTGLRAGSRGSKRSAGSQRTRGGGSKGSRRPGSRGSRHSGSRGSRHSGSRGSRRSGRR